MLFLLRRTPRRRDLFADFFSPTNCFTRDAGTPKTCAVSWAVANRESIRVFISTFILHPSVGQIQETYRIGKAMNAAPE